MNSLAMANLRHTSRVAAVVPGAACATWRRRFGSPSALLSWSAGGGGRRGFCSAGKDAPQNPEQQQQQQELRSRAFEEDFQDGVQVSSTSDYTRVRELWKRSGQLAKVSLSAVKADGKTPRFYDRAEVAEVEDGWTFVLDGRHVMSEAGNDIIFPSRGVAELVAAEWDYQRDFIRPVTMPLMKLCSTASEQIPVDKLEMLHSFKGTLENDVVAQRNRDNPTIVRLQNKFYNPILLWMEEMWGDRLRLTEWVASRDQPFDLILDVLDHVALMDDWRFAMLDTLTTQTSSVMLPLAIVEGRMDLETALQASRIEVDWQMRRDGRVEGLFNHGIDLEYNRMVISAVYCLLDQLRGMPTAKPAVPAAKQVGSTTASAEAATGNETQAAELPGGQITQHPLTGEKVAVLQVSPPLDGLAVLRENSAIHNKLGGVAISGMDQRRFAKNKTLDPNSPEYDPDGTQNLDADEQQRREAKFMEIARSIIK